MYPSRKYLPYFPLYSRMLKPLAIEEHTKAYKNWTVPRNAVRSQKVGTLQNIVEGRGWNLFPAQLPPKHFFHYSNRPSHSGESVPSNQRQSLAPASPSRHLFHTLLCLSALFPVGTTGIVETIAFSAILDDDEPSTFLNVPLKRFRSSTAATFERKSSEEERLPAFVGRIKFSTASQVADDPSAFYLLNRDHLWRYMSLLKLGNCFSPWQIISRF